MTGDSWDTQLPNIIEQLGGQNPDIVLLNEAWTRTWTLWPFVRISNQVEVIAKGIGLPYYMWGNTRTIKLFLDGYGWKIVGVISRYPLSNPVVHPGADGFNTLEVTASINDVPHRIFSTRFAPIHDETARKHNEEGHLQAIELLQRFDLGTPMIFGGDFNAEMTTPQFRDFVYRSGLSNAYIEYQEHLADPCVDRNKGPIDHIFYRGPHKVSRMELSCPWPGGTVSDHPWVLVELSKVDTAPLMGYCSLQSLNFPARYIRPQNSLGELTEISSPLDRRDATFRVVPGLADNRYVSFESANYANYFLRHQDYRLKLHPRSEEWLFKADATFMPIGGLADASATSFRSYNYPSRYLRHKDFRLWVETDGGDTFHDHANDATFKVVPPLIATPIQTLRSATTLGGSAVPVSLSWSATDSDGIVTRYELQRSTDEGAYANVALATPTTTTITQSLSPNHTYRFRVRVQDNNGNWSTWRYGQSFTVDARQENGTGVSYPNGTWTRQSLASAYGGALKYTRAGGARSRLAFSGANVAWVATKGPERGRAEVWLDGTKVATVDLYSRTVQARRVVFARNGLSTVDTHMLEVRVLGTKNASSTGTRVDVDSFVVLLRSDTAVGGFSATQNPK